MSLDMRSNPSSGGLLGRFNGETLVARPGYGTNVGEFGGGTYATAATWPLRWAAMTFEYEEKPSRSRFVDIVWRTHDTSDGTYLAAADACWDMIFIRSVHGNRVLLSGPSSKITPVPYRAGNRNVGIRFHRGTFLTHVPTTAMVDTTEALPMPTDETFQLAGLDWPMPTFEIRRRLRGGPGAARPAQR